MFRPLFSLVMTILLLFNPCGISIAEEVADVKKLPPPEKQGSITVEQAIAGRRSVRSFAASPLSIGELSQLLWAAQGITEPDRGLRSAPSAGATYPLETYAVTGSGVFHYLPDTHSLEQLKAGDFRSPLADAALGQECVRQAPVTIVFAAVPERTTKRYGQRGVMFIQMEAGHSAQNIHLQAVALGLGSVPVGAFDEKSAARTIGIPDGQVVLYMIPVGRSK